MIFGRGVCVAKALAVCRQGATCVAKALRATALTPSVFNIFRRGQRERVREGQA